MVETASVFKSPRAKIDRARELIAELKQRGQPLDPKLYDIINSGPGPKTILHRDATHYTLRFHPRRNIPDVLASIIGDAFNNLREALDYSAAAIVDTWGTRPKGPLYFPAVERKDVLAHSGLKAMEDALPGLGAAFLKDIRPDHDPDDRLWNLYKLQRDQKHNDFIPIVTAGAVRGLEIKVGNVHMTNVAFAGSVERDIRIAAADQIPIKVKGTAAVDVDIRFATGTEFDGDEVIATLERVADLVTKTVEWLAQHSRNVKGIK